MQSHLLLGYSIKGGNSLRRRRIMNIGQLLIAAAVTATVMTFMSEGLDRWERVALYLGTFFITLFIAKLIQKVRAEK